MRKIYPARVSYKLLIIIFLISYLPIIIELIKEQIITKRIIGIFIFMSLIIFLVSYIFFKTKYIIDNQHLNIVCGFFKYSAIDINDITEINKTKSFIAAPAPSFDRIKISYNRYDNIIISPKNKMDFINNLLLINPKINNKVN